MKLRHPFTCLLLVCSLASANAEENNHGRWTARSAQPATRWEDAFVTGNAYRRCLDMERGLVTVSRTGDKKMMRRRVLPLYREMAQFYEDFLVMEGDSLYHILPSVSPENAVQGTYTWFSRAATTSTTAWSPRMTADTR